MEFDNEIVFRIPAPSDGLETVLVLFGIAAVLLAVLAGFQHRETLARRIDWLKKHPWEKASTPVNLLSWVTLICVGPVAAVLFVMAVDEAYALLQQTGGSESSAGSLGRGAVIVALIGAPFVIWRSVVAQKTVSLQEQGHITDRINKAVEGLGAEKTIKRDKDEYTQPNLEVRIGAIYALERIAQDSDRDHVQIMEILCAYIRQNAPAPAEDDWPDLKMKDSKDEEPLEADWEERLKTFRKEQKEKKATLKLREDIQVALTVIGRRDSEQRKIEAGPGRGAKAAFPFDDPCPDYDGPDDDHDPAALDAYRKMLWNWREILDDYKGYRLDLRDADLRGADLSGADLKGAQLNGAYLHGSDLCAARLQGASLRKTLLQGADLSNAQLQAADLASSQLQGANLRSARLQAATPSEAQLYGADLERAQCQVASFYNAKLQGANLTWAGFHGTDLISTRLQGAHFDMITKLFSVRDGTFYENFSFKGPNFQGAKFSEVTLFGIHWGLMFDDDAVEFETNFRGSALRKTYLPLAPIISRHLASVFGDASVILSAGPRPGHDDWPKHWPTFELGVREFHDEWRKWQADPDTYRPPDPPKPEDTA